MAETNGLLRHTVLVCFALLFASISIIVRADGSSSGENSEFDYDDVQILNFREANFSTYNATVKYKSTTLNDPKGMAPLYNITNRILDFFLNEEPILDGYVEINENFNVSTGQKFRDHQWFDVLKHYWPILLVILISGLLAALMPIIG